MNTGKNKKPTYDFTGDGLFGNDAEEEQGTQKQDGILELRIEALQPYHNHMFGLYEGTRLDEMLASVRENGILVPILVREYGGVYEILAGHNRVNAARMAGLDTVPAKVLCDISEEKAQSRPRPPNRHLQRQHPKRAGRRTGIERRKTA